MSYGGKSGNRYLSYSSSCLSTGPQREFDKNCWIAFTKLSGNPVPLQYLPKNNIDGLRTLRIAGCELAAAAEPQLKHKQLGNGSEVCMPSQELALHPSPFTVVYERSWAVARSNYEICMQNNNTSARNGNARASDGSEGPNEMKRALNEAYDIATFPKCKATASGNCILPSIPDSEQEQFGVLSRRAAVGRALRGVFTKRTRLDWIGDWELYP
eukprot:IDg13702t1